VDKGKLIVFEGVDGSGKGTQIRLALEWMKARGLDVESHREPGGTAVGERIRALLLDTSLVEMAPRTEVMLFFASRVQLAQQRIIPALLAGKNVVLDRYYFSTAAYQGPFIVDGVDRILAIAELAELPRPDIVVCLDIDPDTAAARKSGEADRIEAKGLEYQRTVRDAYQTMAIRWPEWFRLVDASRPIASVHEEIVLLLGKAWGARKP